MGDNSKPCRRCQEAGEACTYSPPVRLGRPRKRDRDAKAGEKQKDITCQGSWCRHDISLPSPLNSMKSSCTTCTASPTITDEIPIDMNGNGNRTETGTQDYSKYSTSSEKGTGTASTCSLQNVSDGPCVDIWSDMPESYYLGLDSSAMLTLNDPNIMDESGCDVLFDHEELSCNNMIPNFDNPCSSSSAATSTEPPSDTSCEPEYYCDPIPLLSEIQLQLHAVRVPKTSQSREWKVVLDRTVQIAQSFIQTLNRLLLPACRSTLYPKQQQRQQQQQRQKLLPYFLNQLCKLSNGQVSIAGNLSQPRVDSVVDTIVIRLALICYIQVLGCYKDLMFTLTDSLSWMENNQDDEVAEYLLPIRVGTLQADVSPQLHIAMLAQLISHHANELHDKIRRLAARVAVVENRSENEDRSSAALSEIIGIDICSQEEDLRDGLHQIIETLRRLMTR